MKKLSELQSQLTEWNEKLAFFKKKEAELVDLEQKFNANKKIKDAPQPNILEKLKDSSDIETLHQALDIFMQDKDKLDHKASFESIEKIKHDLIDKILGDYNAKIKAIPILKSKFVINLFEIIYTSEKLPQSVFDDIQNIRKDSDYQYYERSLIVSSLTLSVLSWKKFDPSKINCLIDFLTDAEDDVWQRALVGIILSAILHQNRLHRYQLAKRLQMLQDIDKVQIGIFIIDLILRNQLYKSIAFSEKLTEHEFFKDKVYNWFLPFYEGNFYLLLVSFLALKPC